LNRHGWRTGLVFLSVWGGLVGFDVYAVDVALRWDYPASGAAGFALYCGPGPFYYLTRIDVGYADTWTLSLADGAVHFCSVTAYDPAGLESAFSNEVAIAVRETTGVVEVIPPLVVAATGGVVPTATGVRVTFNAPFDSTWLNLYGSRERGEGPADVVLERGEDEDPLRGSLVIDDNDQGFTFLVTEGTLAPGTYTLTISAFGFADAFGRPLDGDADGRVGDDYRVVFAVGPSAGPVLSVAEFARGPGQPVNLPAVEDGAGLPVYISQGAAVHDVAFTLKYNPALLSVQAVTLGETIGGNLKLESLDPVAGVVVVRVTNLSGLTDERTVLVRLQAAVPKQAAYGRQHLLDLRDLEFNGGTLAGRDDDGLHVVAYLGDTSGEGFYSSYDALQIQRVIIRVDTGFSAFKLTDPTILGDVNGTGRLESADARLIQLKVLRKYVPEIPDIPEEDQ
jgi:hypothetical protein